MIADAIVLTESQRHVMEHALGLDWRPLPYRNGFMASSDHADRGTCEELVAMGLMEFAVTTFFVTDRGYQLMFGREWETMKARAEK
jgi:hypothetical protein